MINFIQKIGAKILRGIMTAYVYVAFRPSVKYVDKSVKKIDKPIILVGNHTSHNDGIMTSVIFSRYKGCILVAKDWYEKKSINWFLKNNRCIPMDRFGLDTAWLRLSMAALKSGQSIIMYPEGKTRKEFEPDEFKPGFVMLALSTGAAIVPYAVDGTYNKFFGKRQRVLVGLPTELTKENKSMKPAYLESESERFRQLVIELRKNMEDKK